MTDSREYIEQVYKAHYMTGLMSQGMTKGAAHNYALNQLWPSIGYQTWTAPAGQTIIGTDGRFNPDATPGYLNEEAGYYYIGDDWSKQLSNGLRQEYNL